jgi:hypothetical protein
MAVSNAQRIRAVQSSLYVLTETGDVFKSTDAGVNWAAIGTLSQVGMRGLVHNGGTLAAATKEGHVATSGDGATWTWQGSMNQLALTALASNEPATTGVEPKEPSGGISLGAPYPNPSTSTASFSLRLDAETDITVVLCDIAGRAIARRSAERYGPGQHLVTWTPRVERSGLYFLVVESSSGLGATRRWLLLR